MTIRDRLRVAKVGRAALSTLLLVSMLALMAPLATTSAQTQIVTATPGEINLGMATTISVTAPAAGTYSVVVEKPNGGSTSLNFVFTAAGQTQNQTFGNATAGFGTVVTGLGTYNVFVTQGSTVVGTTSFYVTNKLNISMDMVNGGNCYYIAGASRGTKMFPRFYITYASNGAPVTNATKGIYVTYTLPDGSKLNATWHKPTVEAPVQGGSGGSTGFYIGKFQPGWNYTAVGPWSPTVTVGDAYGNTATYAYTGPAFTLVPATLATNTQLIDNTTGLPIAAIASGESIDIRATITYPTNAEPVTGFVAPLDTAARGGAVTAIVGWGYWNATAQTFGGSTKNPGGVIATVPLKYTGANGTWTGLFTGATLPAIPTGATYAVAVISSDKASPPNTGLQVVSLAAASAPPGVATTTTVISTSISSSISTTVSMLTSTVSQTVESIPTIAYAGMAIILVLGLIIGMVVRMPRK